MDLFEIIHRAPKPAPWSEGEKIPWNDPGFSARMLKEHLSQSHDLASRRTEKIEQQVAWIHHHVLAGRQARILDLGCGPGLYAIRLAQRGHCCRGIDFSPASIAYAAAQAADLSEDTPLECTYLRADIRTAEYGGGYDLVMLIFGEFNVFTPADARKILDKAYTALLPGGTLLLELSAEAAVREMGTTGPGWYSAKSGLFSDKPYICLTECFWDAVKAAATERYFIIDARTGKVSRYAATTQAYSGEQSIELLHQAGFTALEFHPSLTGEEDASQAGFFVLMARKTAA